MKKADFVLLGIVIAASVIIFLGYSFFTGRYGSEGKGEVVITVDGIEYGRYDLEEDRVIEIGSTNRLEIRDGIADMVWADCPDKLCVKHISIKRSGESIICLPNKVVVTIENAGESSDFDTLVR